MKVGACFPSKYIKGADLVDRPDLILTIEEFNPEEVVGQGEQAEKKPVIHFSDHEQALVLNKTNAKAIASALGSDDTDDWTGKRVALYAADVDAFGEMVTAVRVRSKAPAASAKSSGAGKAPAVPVLAPNAVARLQERAKAEGFDIEGVGLWLREVGKFHIPAPAIAATWPAVCGPKVADAIAAVLGGWVETGQHEPIGEDDIPFD